jgi:hypothetical protein
MQKLSPIWGARCYKSNSDRKSLIYKNFQDCFFCGHFSEKLDFQGFGVCRGKLSTKLSTESMNVLQNYFKSMT